MALESRKIDNQLAHLGRQQSGNGRLVNLPLSQGSTMLFDSLEHFERSRNDRYQTDTLYYGRYGNEASFALESMMATLEGADHCISVSSGLTAVTVALMAATKSGDHLLVADTVYGPTRSFCDSVLSRFGVEITYFDPMIGADLSSLIKSNTTAVMLEAPGTGTFEVPDLPRLASVCKDKQILTILDGTWATPVFCQPLSLGIDVVVHSGSKYISGHSDVMIGFIVCNNAHYQSMRKMVLAIGDRAGSQDIFLTLRGLRTLQLRMQNHESAGIELVNWFRQQPLVSRVLHPTQPDCPGHEFWARDFNGSSGLFSVLFKQDSVEKIHKFIDGLEMFGLGVSWGGFESLALPMNPTSMRTANPWTESGSLVRFSIGNENREDLKADLTQAMEHLN